MWLLSTSLLAVVAGYGVLFLVGSSIRQQQRFAEHQQLADALIAEMQKTSSGEFSHLIPSIDLQFLGAGQPSPPQLITSPEGSAWLVSRHWLASPGRYPLIEVRQNITAQRQQDRFDQLLLVAAAGGSMLFTALLLRPVLQRGLTMPLADLREQLIALEADSLGQRSIDLALQPSELQPIAREFNALQDRLAAAWQRERRFVDGVAHELRTPIAVISAQAQRLMQGSSIKSVETAPSLMASEAERMGELVRSLMDFARSDSGRLALNLQTVDPETALLEAYERLLPLAPTRLQLAEPSAQVIPRIVVDSDRLQQCLAALIDNAIKYSTAAVTLSCQATQVEVVLHVRDVGPGIPPEERQRVLQRFERGRAAVGVRGSGIGLATVSMLAKAMNADLVIGEGAAGGADLQLRFRLSAAPPAP